MPLLSFPACSADAASLADRLRWEDLRELQTANSTAPIKKILTDAVRISREAYALTTEPPGSPFALLGVADSRLQEGAGAVWMVASPEVTRHRLNTLAVCRDFRDRWTGLYPSGLHNFIDTRNLLHIRWLQLLGFRFGRKVLVQDVEFIFTYYVPTKGVSLPCVSPSASPSRH